MFNHWSFDPTRNVYTGTFEVADNLPSGLYKIEKDGYNRPEAQRLELRDDTIITFEHGPLPLVMAEISKFWTSAAHYKRLGVSHKRGILLYGPPGCGKTGIISSVIENAIANNGIVFQIDDIYDFQDSILLARQIEKGRPITAIIEDIERIVEKDEKDEETLLEVMDGASSVGNGTLFVATTNNLDLVPARVRCRPSRIDTLIEIGFPNKEQRYEYLSFLLEDENGLMPDNVHRGRTKQWAEKTDNFSLAMLKELVIGVQVYNKPLEQAITILKEMAGTEEKPEDKT